MIIEEEPINEEATNKVKEENKQDYKTIRTQQLVECKGCKTMMTATSLKYYHRAKCPVEPVAEIKSKPNAKPKPNKEEVVIIESDEEVKIIKPINSQVASCIKSSPNNELKDNKQYYF